MIPRRVLMLLVAAIPATADAATSQREADQFTIAILSNCGIEGTQFGLRRDTQSVLHAEISPTLDPAKRQCAADFVNDAHLGVPELPATPGR